MLGAHSEAKDPTPEVQEIADSIKEELKTKTGKSLDTYKLEKYTSQVVAGMNYKLKIKIGDGDNDYIHVKVFRALPHAGGTLTVNEVQDNKTLADPL